MGTSIDDFKSTVMKHDSLALPNRFNVIFTPPKMSLLNLNVGNLMANAVSGGLKARNFINDPRDISMLCKSANMPGRQITTLDHQAHRETHKIPYTYIDEDFTAVFHLTQDYYIKSIFDNWAGNIFDDNTYTAAYKKDFTTDIRIQQLNKEDKVVYGARLLNAYPTSIGGVAFTNDGENQTLDMSVTFSYDRCVEENALASSIGAFTQALDLI